MEASVSSFQFSASGCASSGLDKDSLPNRSGFTMNEVVLRLHPTVLESGNPRAVVAN